MDIDVEGLNILLRITYLDMFIHASDVALGISTIL